ncbi:MAG: alpha/beta hydrolase [Candidatus Binataceae bacterium]
MESSPTAPDRAKPKSTNHPRRFALIGAVMIGVAVVLWAGAATLVAYRIKYPTFLEDGRTDVYGPHAPAADAPIPIDPHAAFGADFENVRIPIARDNAVAAWMIPGKLPAAVLLVPPAGGTRRTMLPCAKFLHDAGYPVLAIDSGDDAKSGTTWGWRERLIVLSAASELKRRGFKKIGALGVSEGAAEILMDQASGASFAAIVSDSAYGSLSAMLERVPSLAVLNPALQRTALWEAGFFLGHSIWKIDPLKAARDLGSTEILVIHNQDDKIVPVSDAQAISSAAGNRSELWIVPGDGHGDAIYEVPAEYASRVLKFLAQNLLAPSSDGPRNSAELLESREPRALAVLLLNGGPPYIRGGIRSTSSVDLSLSNSLSISHGPSL